MSILVVCPGCHKRFQVSDQFAGRTGPCPKCKTQIKIPDKNQEVKIDAPEDAGPKDTSGKLVLKPIERRAGSIPLPAVGVGVAAAVVLLAMAWLIGGGYADPANFPTILLAAGAVICAPPLVYASYLFLMDDEMEPYSGMVLYIRTAICSVLYVLLWGGISWARWMLFPESSPEFLQILMFVSPFAIAGSVVAYASLDLDPTNSAIHYGIYLVFTVLLRLAAGLPAF